MIQLHLWTLVATIYGVNGQPRAIHTRFVGAPVRQSGTDCRGQSRSRTEYWSFSTGRGHRAPRTTARACRTSVTCASSRTGIELAGLAIALGGDQLLDRIELDQAVAVGGDQGARLVGLAGRRREEPKRRHLADHETELVVGQLDGRAFFEALAVRRTAPSPAARTLGIAGIALSMPM